MSKNFHKAKPLEWAQMDSNHRSRKTADLQSAPFGRSGIRPRKKQYLAKLKTFV